MADSINMDLCPVYAPFFGAMVRNAGGSVRGADVRAGCHGGDCVHLYVRMCVRPLTRAGLGASYGTAKSGVGISAMGVLRPDLLIKCIIPVVMAGIIAVRPSEAVPVLTPTDLRPGRQCSDCRRQCVV